MFQDNAKYTEDHEWVILEDGIATIGISNHAIEELGEVVFIELPESNIELSQSDEFGTIESVKTVSSLYTPLSGTIIETNTFLKDNPEIINESPYGDGWLIKVKAEKQSEYDVLMTCTEYQSYIESL